MKRKQSANLTAVLVDYDNIYLALKRKSDEAARRFAKDSALWLREVESGRLITPTKIRLSGSMASHRPGSQWSPWGSSHAAKPRCALAVSGNIQGRSLLSGIVNVIAAASSGIKINNSIMSDYPMREVFTRKQYSSW